MNSSAVNLAVFQPEVSNVFYTDDSLSAIEAVVTKFISFLTFNM